MSRTPRTSVKARARKTRREKRSVAPKANHAHDTRLALLRAAERLMAERGIDAVSLREVSAAAGQLNNSAVAYHFGSRDALIDAILERHSAPIHERWDAQLDFIERQGGVGLRPLVEMLVIDIMNKLDDPDGGFEYLSICGQLLVTPNHPLTQRAASRTPPVLRLIEAIHPHYGVPLPLVRLRSERLAAIIYTSLLAWHLHERAKDLPISRAVFASELVDSIVAMITQPLSRETQALLDRDTGE